MLQSVRDKPKYHHWVIMGGNDAGTAARWAQYRCDALDRYSSARQAENHPCTKLKPWSARANSNALRARRTSATPLVACRAAGGATVGRVVISFFSVMFAESGAAAPFDRLGQTLRWHDYCTGRSHNTHWRHKVFFRPSRVLWVGVHWVMENDGSLLFGKYLTLPTSVVFQAHGLELDRGRQQARHRCAAGM